MRHDLLRLLRSLHADPAQPARAVGAAGREFARTWLSFESVLAYLHTLLATYAELYERGRISSGAPPLSAEGALRDGFVRVDSEDDLPHLTGTCTCDESVRERPRRVCAARADAPVHPALRKLARCTLWARPGHERCFDRRCCVGWDCGTRPLGCPS